MADGEALPPSAKATQYVSTELSRIERPLLQIESRARRAEGLSRGQSHRCPRSAGPTFRRSARETGAGSCDRPVRYGDLPIGWLGERIEDSCLVHIPRVW